MVRLIRDSLVPLVPKATDGHAGLLMQRGLQVWEVSEKKDKHDLIDLITSIQASDLYLLAFNRWLKHTHTDAEKNPHFASTVAQVDGRLFTGLATGGTLETGATTHHTYGMPMLAGSAVKGAVRAYAESIFLLKDAEGKVIVDEKGKTQINPAMKDILNILFGTDEDAPQQNAGYLIWHDAWWVPFTNNSKETPFVSEIVTVHHQKYYAGQLDEALDMESAIPNQQIAIQGHFYFTIEGEPQWVKFAKDLLENMLQQMGMGAKGTSGYGYFKPADKQIINLINDFIKSSKKEAQPEYKNLLDDLREKVTKSPKGGGLGGNTLGQDLRKMIELSKDWPIESYADLRKVAEIIYAHIGADRSKKGAAKDLWKTLP